MKTVLFVPGFREGLQDRDYASVLKVFKSTGYRPQFVSINWKRTTVDDWLKALSVEYDKCEPHDTILAGFSYGSLIAFVAAAKRLPAELWLFSLSPYFSDDLPKLKKSWKNDIGHRRITAFNTLNFAELANHVTCPTLIMLGSVEAAKYPMMVNRAQIARKAIKNNRYITVSGADHDITDKGYVQAIKKAIGQKEI